MMSVLRVWCERCDAVCVLIANCLVAVHVHGTCLDHAASIQQSGMARPAAGRLHVLCDLLLRHSSSAARDGRCVAAARTARGVESCAQRSRFSRVGLLHHLLLKAVRRRVLPDT